MGEGNVTYFVAFVAGLLTFLSPCILPLIPSFIVYITGVAFKDLKSKEVKREVRFKTITHTLIFIAGFSVVFILLGLTATAIGKALFNYQSAIRVGGGILIIIFGFYLIGLLKLDFLMKERQVHVKYNGAAHISSFLVGVTFAAAWTPCAGPILGSILVMAGTESNMLRGAMLLVMYSVGVGIPFIITALTINHFLAALNRFTRIFRYINIVGGIFLIIVGVLVATNSMQSISEKLLMIFSK